MEAFGARRGMVHVRDAEGEGIGRLIGIDAAVGRQAVILHLEGEAGVGRAGRSWVGRKDQALRRLTSWPAGDGRAADGQRALGGQRGDDHRLQAVGRRIAGIERAADQRGEVGAVGGEGEVPSSLMVLALSAPTGWLLTAVMFRVMVAGPEVLFVVPVSVTVNVKVGAAELPLFLSAAGVKRSWPALSWARLTVWRR